MLESTKKVRSFSPIRLLSTSDGFILVLLLTMLYCPQLQAQRVKTFVGADGGEGMSIQQTSDGGYVLTGQMGNDVLVLRLDSNGNILWQKTFGGTGHDHGASIQQTRDGGYILTGTISVAGVGDVLVLRLDSNGNILWQKTFGGTGHDYGASIQQTRDGGYILTGTTGSFRAGATDILVLKLDSNGNVVLQKTFGGFSDDFGTSIQQTKDGGYILTGISSLGVLVLKLDSNGNIGGPNTWQKTFGGISGGYSIQQTRDGGYILTGSIPSSMGGYEDVLVLKLDSNGNVVLRKTFGGTGHDYGASIQQTSDGGYILTGTIFVAGVGDVLVLKLDSNGNVLWQKTFGGSSNEQGNSIQQTSDGGYVLTGQMGNDVLVLRLDSNGNIPGCTYLSNANVTEDVASFATNNINSTVTDLSQSMVGVNVTVKTPSFAVNTICP